MQVKEYRKNIKTKVDKAVVEDMIKKLRKEHEKPVKGMFEFCDAKGGWLDFCYRFFKDDPIYTIRLNHGEICEIPWGIVKHLNNTYKKIRTISPNLDEKGLRGVPMTVEKTSRIRFTPIEVL